MHGGMGLDHSYLRRGLDPLGAQAQLVYYDHRGNGRSPRPATAAGWDALTHQGWIADADALRAALGHERVTVFGHSYGGLLAQEYALAYPDRVAGLVLCATFPAFDYAPAALARAAARATPAQLATLLEAFGAPIADDAAFGAAFRAVLPLYFHAPGPARLAVLADVRYSAAAFARAQWGCLPHASTLGRLGEITAPTLVLAGADDWIAGPAHGAERLQAGIPNAELVVFARSGHFPFVEEPDAFVRTVGTWLDREIRGAEAPNGTPSDRAAGSAVTGGAFRPA
jgi:proline iminopeptidase